MITKTTLEKAAKFVHNCKFIFSFKKNIFQKNIFTLLFCFITAIAFAQSGSCNSEITIEGDKEQKYNGFETSFLLQIKNTGTTTDTYQLSADNFSGFAENPDGSSSQNNILMSNKLQHKNNSALNKTITLAAGESVEFYVKLNLTDSSKLDQWNGTKVVATSGSCPESKNQVILYTYIPPKKTKGIGFNKSYFDLKNAMNSRAAYVFLLQNVVAVRFFS
ncbi:Fn3-like domain-containing protein [Flavobacterium sp. C3NV]|uniref:COG1470 family protein n=1 Tax=Flavobacterium sp. C3NV TaxID=3393358 RepID=UPI00398F8E6E